jgi:hypothetical protein
MPRRAEMSQMSGHDLASENASEHVDVYIHTCLLLGMHANVRVLEFKYKCMYDTCLQSSQATE